MNVMPVVRSLPSRAVLRQWAFPDGLAGRPNAHAGIEISWCTTGSADYRIADRHVTLRPGEAIVIPADVEHTTDAAPGTSARSIHVSMETVSAAADALGVSLREASVVPGSVDQPTALVTLGSLLSREADGERKGKALLVESLTDAVVIEALRASPGQRGTNGGDGRVRRAVEMIHERYAEPLSIDDLARAAHMSRYHFSRVFRAHTGKSPYRYLIDVRMTRAAHLLRAKRCGVTEAAFSVGCADLGRFGRMFRSIHGVRPSEYLRRAAS
jgi:AraC family transcriptional regulator